MLRAVQFQGAMVPILLLITLAAEPSPLPSNRTWDTLEAGEPKAMFAEVAKKIGRRVIVIDGVRFDRKLFSRLAKSDPKEPFLRAVREATRRPVDVQDLLYFVDDVLAAPPRSIWLPASRARRNGIFIHPDDVFFDKPRLYGTTATVAVDRPKPIARAGRAKDGEPLGPRWCRRFPNPSGNRRKLRALGKMNPSGFSARIESLMKQLKRQGASVLLYSTVRDRRRGYLIWGAYSLSKLETKAAVDEHVALLDRLNTEWKLNVPIRWRHDDGWEATVEAARKMAGTYNVAYATRAGAERSSHYDGLAVDLNVFGLPRTLELRAPDGTKRTFDLSAADETRDLSLTPALIEWIEKHFEMQKLREDYPHWNDAAKPKPE